MVVGRLLFGMPLSVMFLILSFSSRALFMRSSYFCIVRCWRSDASLAASLDFLVPPLLIGFLVAS